MLPVVPAPVSSTMSSVLSSAIPFISAAIIFNAKTLIVITLLPSTDTAILVSVIPAASNMPNSFLSRPHLSASIPNTDISSSPSLIASETGSARTGPTSISSSSPHATPFLLLSMLPSSASSGEKASSSLTMPSRTTAISIILA